MSAGVQTAPGAAPAAAGSTARPARRLRVAAFGFRSLPPRAGAAGADKFALELFPRLVAMGCDVTAYSRVYPGETDDAERDFRGVRVVPLKTVSAKGFDTLLHSLKATWRILTRDRVDVVHIQNGGNSPFAGLLRLFGMRTYISQDGADWARRKWSWYARIYLWVTRYLTAVAPTAIIFDNVFAQRLFHEKFGKAHHFIPFGSEVVYDGAGEGVLARLGLEPGGYFLFVGRFIPDKGLHYLVPAFEGLDAPDIKLVLVGGSPNPSDYEAKIRSTTDPRVVTPGFIYGPEMHALMRHARAYVQPSDVEGLSPVILESAFLGAPVVCSDIPENMYVMQEHAAYFKAGDVGDLRARLAGVLADPQATSDMAGRGQRHVTETYSWEAVARGHLDVFEGRAQQSLAE